MISLPLLVEMRHCLVNSQSGASMGRNSRLRMVSALASLMLSGLSGCVSSDFSTGVSSFSTAVSADDSAEQALIQSANQVRLNQWLAQAGKLPPQGIVIDLAKCSAASGYKQGDCQVVAGNLGPAPVDFAASTSALKSYAQALSKITTDTTCDELKSDGTALAGSLGDLSKSAGGSATGTSAVLSIVATIGCRAVGEYELQILRKTTAAADPIVQSLVAPIQDKDRRLARIVTMDAVAQLETAEFSYQQHPTTQQLKSLVTLAAAVETAQSLSLDKTIAAIADAHARLTQDLKSDKVDLTDVISNAQSIAADAQSIEAAIKTVKAGSGAS